MRITKSKKGSIVFVLVFLISAIMIILVSAVVAPFGVLFNTEMYKAGEKIMLQANDSINNISDPVVRASIQNSISNSFRAQENNIEVNNSIFQYGWIFMLVMTFMVLFLLTRSISERNQGGFV